MLPDKEHDDDENNGGDTSANIVDLIRELRHAPDAIIEHNPIEPIVHISGADKDNHRGVGTDITVGDIDNSQIDTGVRGRRRTYSVCW